MSIRVISIAIMMIIAGGVGAADNEEVEPVQDREVTYVDDVGPILLKHCAECHLPGMQGAVETGFLVDSYESVMKETYYGPVIKPGSARTSSLYILLTAEDNITVNMPHGRTPLSTDEIETIRVWIDNGAVEN